MPKHPNTAAAERAAANRLYTVDWRSTGSSVVKGRAATAKLLGISEKSLGVYISSGKAKRGIVRPCPATGNPDIVTIVAHARPKAPKPKDYGPKRPPGRPRTNPLPEPNAAKPKRGRPRKPRLEEPSPYEETIWVGKKTKSPPDPVAR